MKKQRKFVFTDFAHAEDRRRLRGGVREPLNGNSPVVSGDFFEYEVFPGSHVDPRVFAEADGVNVGGGERGDRKAHKTRAQSAATMLTLGADGCGGLGERRRELARYLALQTEDVRVGRPTGERSGRSDVTRALGLEKAVSEAQIQPYAESCPKSGCQPWSGCKGLQQGSVGLVG